MGAMQRLYSTLYSTSPNGASGSALLALRVALGISVVHAVCAVAASRPEITWVVFAAWATAAALWIGLLTPVACAACVILQLGTWVSKGMLSAPVLCAALDAVALGVLGPGTFSLDDRLFGRRRVIF